jgi:hypothetical protein
MKPEFPLSILFRATGEVVLIETPEEPETELEFFDSDNPGENAIVTDAKGRRVRLVVEACSFRICELMDPAAR